MLADKVAANGWDVGLVTWLLMPLSSGIWGGQGCASFRGCQVHFITKQPQSTDLR